MIEKVERYNAGFGDCYVCSDSAGASKMLVDCGSVEWGSACVFSELNSSLRSSKNNYLMITHFHDDHFNGIRELDGRINFDEIYLPNFLTENIIEVEFAALAGGALGEDYACALNLLMSIPNLIHHVHGNTVVRFLNKQYGLGRQTVKNCLDEINVLWPDMGYVESRARKLCDIIGEYTTGENGLILEQYARRFINIVSEGMDNGRLYISGNNDSRLANNIIRLVEEFTASFKMVMPLSLTAQISRFQNRLCLCFDNALPQNDRPVMFLSDISPSAYNYMKKINRLADCYAAIKAPHHGTKCYFVEALPKSDILFIANDNAKLKWAICNDYYKTYPTSRIITNANCSVCAGNCHRTGVESCVIDLF